MQADGLISQMFLRARSNSGRSLPSWWHTQPVPSCMWVHVLTSHTTLSCFECPHINECSVLVLIPVNYRAWVFIWVRSWYLWGSLHTSSTVRVFLMISFVSTLEPFHLDKVLSSAVMVNITPVSVPCSTCNITFYGFSGTLPLVSYNALVMLCVSVLRKRLAVILNACILSKKCQPNCNHQNKKVTITFLFFHFCSVHW